MTFCLIQSLLVEFTVLQYIQFTLFQLDLLI